MSNELGEFLRSRRAQIRPEDVGFRSGGGRRVEGLRREEVAALASVSVDYIKRLELGKITPSDLIDLCARPPAGRRRAKASLRARRACPAQEIDPFEEVRPGLLRLLAAVEPLPAFVVGPWLDLLAWNATASALFCGFERRPPRERNMARLIFLDPEIRELFCVGGWNGFPASSQRFGSGISAESLTGASRCSSPSSSTLAALQTALGGTRRREEDERPQVVQPSRCRSDRAGLGAVSVPGAGEQVLMSTAPSQEPRPRLH